MMVLVSLLVTLCLVTLTSAEGCVYHDYCVVGAGPSGLQLGYFFKRANRDYVVFERSNISGSFFDMYPRHRKLISLNKRYTGQQNQEFNLRHDWNSLISDDEDLKVTRYSKDVFPHADVLVRYLDDYRKKLKLNVQFNTDIRNIQAVRNMSAPDGHVYTMNDQMGQCYTCRTLIMATGISTPNIPRQVQGIDLTTGYETMSLNPDDYEGKSVLILGRGNTAFEIADSIYGSTNLIHMLARSRVRLAWSTHYVGDLRAVNDALLDTYQLKSLDALLESPVEEMYFVKRGNKIHVEIDESHGIHKFDNFALRESYDVVIRALGFIFDASVFNNTAISRGKDRAKKYPAIHHNYESKDTRGLFYAGTASHSLDFRKSAGGFIHGFRYTARALHRLLEWRYENIPWPYYEIPAADMLNTMIKRMNEASGPYQMFQMLGDVFLFSDDGQSVKVLEEYPINVLHKLPEYTGHNASSLLVVVLEYGHNFSGPGRDVFRLNRATGEPSEAHTSNFLHPVIYYYKTLPTEKMMNTKLADEVLPRPDKIHHIVEDFLTYWNAATSHILPLRRFLDIVRDTDSRAFFSQTCFKLAMTHGNVPPHCEENYLAGQGLAGHVSLIRSAMSHGMMEIEPLQTL
ncbi:FAD-dependent oxidoreductase domain-containing protein 2-like [Physella acuta]|uniref:FAD-dependent oxidoreductase domain-containing protein 2-like n=1 Tax=Physella acuta TaxID=109671 RepID=UPI0027DB1F01|nr:FAD-dependent oxidoreductase domain-containing protein 2-like [Physella acuta]XP_059153474.1 FAD-dependent oxidoreductase domain-containing protein 2-like [Physella acuta]XP_059153475.1 FAD-dependent oxidoreductase domain-containing protein 2-like [Physella acuta]